VFQINIIAVEQNIFQVWNILHPGSPFYSVIYLQPLSVYLEWSGKKV